MDNVSVKSGALQVMRFYDIAYGIDLAALQRAASTEVTRIRLKRTEPKAVDFGVPPLEYGLGTIVQPLHPREDWEYTLRADVVARIFEFGAISISIRCGVSDLSLADFADLANAMEAWADTEEPWRWVKQVRDLVEPHATRPHLDLNLSEDYLIASIKSLSEPMDRTRLLNSRALVTLLSGEKKELSSGARSDLLKNVFSYYTDDLAVITWDRAFLYEPEGDTDITEVLEVANAQLLELRYYDLHLDSELPAMYRRVKDARRRFRLLGRNYAELAHDLYTLVAEVTEITERIDNALKVTEDVYLARIYTSVCDLFRLRVWNADVERKLAIIRDTYSALNDDATHARAELLEVGIFLLIVFEVILGVLRT